MQLGTVRAAVAALLAGIAAPALAADVVMWSHYVHGQREALQQVAEAYNARKGAAESHVKLVFTQGFDGFADKVTGSIPRGKGPDVFVYPQDRLGGWAEAGLIEPLDACADRDTRARFLPSALQALVYRGVIYAMPTDIKLIALFYDRAVVASPPRTTAALAALATKLTRREDGYYGLAYPYTDYWFHAALQNGFGGRVFDPLMNAALDSPENVRALELMLRWKDAFLPPELSREETEAMFNAHKAAMLFSGSWFVSDVAPGIDLGLAELPLLSEAGDAPMRPWMTVEGLYVSTRSTQKVAACDFIRYATDLDAARVMASVGKQIPANLHLQADPAIGADPARRTLFLQARVGVPMPNGPEMTAMWPPATTALGTVARRTATPTAALAKAQAIMAARMNELRKR